MKIQLKPEKYSNSPEISVTTRWEESSLSRGNLTLKRQALTSKISGTSAPNQSGTESSNKEISSAGGSSDDSRSGNVQAQVPSNFLPSEELFFLIQDRRQTVLPRNPVKKVSEGETSAGNKGANSGGNNRGRGQRVNRWPRQ